MNNMNKAQEEMMSILDTIDGGEVACEFNTQMQRVVSAVLSTGNPGKITLSITIKRQGRERQLAISPKVTAAVPAMDIQSRVVFGDDKGQLLLSDPAQMHLALEEEQESPVRVKPTTATKPPKPNPQTA